MLRRSLLTVVVLGLVSSSAFGFNNLRQGFILGGGLGLHQNSFTQTIDFNREEIRSTNETKSGLAVDFKIGYDPTDKLEIYYTTKTSQFSIINMYEDEVTIMNQLGGLGFSYFLSKELDVYNGTDLSSFPEDLAWLHGQLPLKTNPRRQWDRAFF